MSHRLLLLVALLSVAACGESSNTSALQPGGGGETAPVEADPPPTTGNLPTTETTRSTSTISEASMTEGTPIRITIGDDILDGRLWNNPTAHDLIALLPLTLEFRDLNHVEKIARLPRRLSMDGVPEGDDPQPQDIGYYAPSGDLVFYYDDVGYWDGIVRLGVLDSDMDIIRNQTGTFTATVGLVS